MDRDKILPTLLVFGGIVLIIAVLVKFFSEMDDCRARGGVLVNTFFGYDCVPRK